MIARGQVYAYTLHGDDPKESELFIHLWFGAVLVSDGTD
ncbi:putative glycyl-tRNA synthetase subunit alpha [Vibrio parahaemolyticus VPCR-2010]|uniref:Uncharacterized protein n=1 Tax=Vibrio antiquarius (strain Ex25) TaxID=150340 RepID=A0ACA6QID4_VIBAE|nr:hypothetical protein VEA_001995 [Vibrio antiquarius]AGB08549.1 hypothetical protein VPBB_0022 [Vibrio parahaemolyticus BB22OP]AWG82393.1 hypothetical protein Vp2S01_0023 [Vibrio parahaemolyticus]EMD79579.1 hypothetical protein C408_2054 [Vibrio diabolicus E0666]EQL85966.1 putative glycyl-tRNA synthetase subunit alpha [Vibrio parahaemolyticus 10290]EQL99127.1 putative glycyl-tRNA synthetase subunit alpha [Vibrio parahaemolyticus NIHCB0603]EQM06811.1 putative glycyl-tRNA synthetase subunit a